MSGFIFNLPIGDKNHTIPILIKPIFTDNETYFQVIVAGIKEDKSYNLLIDESGDINFRFWGRNIPLELLEAEEEISWAIFEKDI